MSVRDDLAVSLRRRWFRAREMFHDWIWKGGAHPGLLRRVARRLPLHLSDPCWMSPEKFDAALAKGASVILAGSPWIRVEPGQAMTAGTNTWVYMTNTTWDRRETP